MERLELECIKAGVVVLGYFTKRELQAHLTFKHYGVLPLAGEIAVVANWWKSSKKDLLQSAAEDDFTINAAAGYKYILVGRLFVNR